MAKNQPPDDRLPTSARPRDASTQQPAPAAASRKPGLEAEGDESLGEYLITASRKESGRRMARFIVRARDEKAARKMCQRGYLVLESVELYVDEEGKEK